MTEIEKRQCTARLLTALEMYEAGIEMQRARLRRENPQATTEQVEAMVRSWLLSRARSEFSSPPFRVRFDSGDS